MISVDVAWKAGLDVVSLYMYLVHIIQRTPRFRLPFQTRLECKDFVVSWKHVADSEANVVVPVAFSSLDLLVNLKMRQQREC